MNKFDIVCSKRVFDKDTRSPLYHSSGTIVCTRHNYDELTSFDVQFDDGTVYGFAAHESYKFSELP